MYAQKLEALPPPPGVIGSLKAGFEVVSSHVVLILIPFAVDLFLWLGPRLSVNRVLGPFYALMFAQARRGLPASDDTRQLTAIQDMFNEVLTRFNLVSLFSRLQTFPIGVSSLMARTMPVDNPVGENIVQVPSPLSLIGYMFLLVVIGWVIGGLYFRWVSKAALGRQESEISPIWAILQTFILSIVWLILLFAISIPVVFLLTLLMFISPILASAVLFVMMLLSFWVIVPLFFIPHGIFTRKQNAFYSIFSSFKMARFTLPTSGMFVFSILILSPGLNYLWSVPTSNSWMTVVGIAGHAFITTALLAASFVYYHEMNVWLQKVIEQLQPKKNVLA